MRRGGKSCFLAQGHARSLLADDPLEFVLRAGRRASQVSLHWSCCYLFVIGISRILLARRRCDVTFVEENELLEL